MKTMLSMKKCHCLRIVVIFAAILALMAGMVACEEQPTTTSEIWDWYDLDAVRDNLSGSHVLMKDIDSTTAGYTELASNTANQGKGWQPIGTQENAYTGTFDGQGYEISDLFINHPSEANVGLFGVVDERGLVRNVGVVNADVTGEWFVGGLVGYANECTISNCQSTGSATGDSYVGGLVGWNRDTVRNCYSLASVTGEWLVGGLVGHNRGTVSNSYSSGVVSGNEDVGGLVGRNYEAIVSNSFWDSQTSGQTTSDGGTGKTTAEMKSIATFTAWDIIAVAPGQTNSAYIWNIVDGETYPLLSWQS